MKREMELSEAIPLLEQAYNEYTEASFFCKTAKGERKKALERDMATIYCRVKNIFSFCPSLYDYVETDFFEYPHFDSDFGELIAKLKSTKDCPKALI